MIEHIWKSIPGYFTFPDYYAHVARSAGRQWRGVEVGVYTGQSAAFLTVELAHAGVVDARLDLVDRELSKHGAEANLAPLAHLDIIGEFLELDSVAAANLYVDASLDFVFIDADHAYGSVARDIDAWLPKVKPGGVIAGHDHCPDFPGVIQAVTERFSRYEVYRGERGPGWGDARMVSTGQYYAVWSVTVGPVTT